MVATLFRDMWRGKSAAARLHSSGQI
jgi:hypothetical protein